MSPTDVTTQASSGGGKDAQVPDTSTEVDKDEGWMTPGNRKQRRVVRGRMRDGVGVSRDSVTLFANNFNKDHTEKKLKDRLRGAGITPISCFRFYKEGLDYCSFKFRVRPSDVDACFNPDIWPEYATVRDWVEKSPEMHRAGKGNNGAYHTTTGVC